MEVAAAAKPSQLKSRLLQPPSPAPAYPEPGLPDSYGFEYPSIVYAATLGAALPKALCAEHVILQSNI